MQAEFSRIESEKFVVDRTYHTWIYRISTGLKTRTCKIELPQGAEDIVVSCEKYGIDLRPVTNVFTMGKGKLPLLSSFETSVSFVTRPRTDEVISYTSEIPELADSRHCVKVITVQNRQNYDVERIRLERTLDFEPPFFKVEELSNGVAETRTARIETSKDNLGRTDKSMLTWETSFRRNERKSFRISYGFSSEEERTASAIIRLVTDANLLFSKITSVERIFQDSMIVADELHTPCRSGKDFAHKIGVLCQLFEVPLQPLRNLLSGPADPDWQSIRLLEEWLNQKKLSYDPLTIKTWRYIMGIRNKSPPFHRPDSRIFTFIAFFGQNYPPDYPFFWLSILNRLKESLVEFVEILAQIP